MTTNDENIQEEELDEFTLEAEIITVNIQLTEEHGTLLKELIQENYAHTYPRYCERVGIKTPNFYTTMNGLRPCTLDFLNKLLSGIGYEASISNPEIQIREIETGGIVKDVDSLTLDEELSLNDTEDTET